MRKEIIINKLKKKSRFYIEPKRKSKLKMGLRQKKTQNGQTTNHKISPFNLKLHKERKKERKP